MAESDTWEREEDLEHVRELVDEFEERLSMEARRQEGGNQKQKRISSRVEECKKMELPGKYMAKLLYGWDDRKFEAEYLRKLKRSWQRWRLVSLEEKP